VQGRGGAPNDGFAVPEASHEQIRSLAGSRQILNDVIDAAI